MSLGHVALIAAGTALLALGGSAATGRWRGWARDLAGGPMAITLVPACGLMLVVLGLAPVLPDGLRDVLFMATLLALFAGFVLFLWQPDWLGPRWSRERDRSALHQDVPLNAAILSTVKPDLGASGSEATAVGMFRGRTPVSRWRAHLVSDRYGHPSAMQRAGVVRGHLLVFPEALVFAAGQDEDRMRERPVVEVLTAEGITGARRWRAGRGPDGRTLRRDLPSWVMPRLRVDTTDGAWVFESSRAGALLAEIEHSYLSRPRSEGRSRTASVSSDDAATLDRLGP